MGLFGDTLMERFEQAGAKFPRFDTRGVTPVGQDDKQGVVDFLMDNLAAGVGSFMETGARGIESAMRPDNMTPTEWHEEFRNRSYDIPWIEDTGRAMKEHNQRSYTPGTAKYYGSMALQSLPEMGADMAASLAASAALIPILGPLAPMAKSAATATKWGRRAYDAYQGAGRAAQAARYLTPTLPTVAMTMTGTPLESAFEGQRAADEYVEQAKANGTYIPDQTELEAEDLRSRVFRDNAAAITGTNMVQNAATFGNMGGGWKGNLARLALAMGTEGIEEGIQEIIPKVERGEDWSLGDRDVQDAALVGALMGGAMHGAGRAGRYAIDRMFPSQDEDSTIEDIIRRNSGTDQPQDGDTSTIEDIVRRNQGQDGNTQGGVKPYNMPTQGDNITEQVQQLTPEFQAALPTIGGILRDRFGLDGVISSGGRTREHQMEVNPSAPNSYHIIGENGGNAVDIVLPDSTTSEQAQAVKKYFEDSGSFAEVLYHDAGSGYHLHLAGYKGGLDGGAAQERGHDPNFTDKQNEAWKEAQWVSRQTGIPAEYIYRQWAHESGNFTSQLARENNNFGGLTQTTPNGEENKQQDGSNYYRKYGNMHEYAESYVNDFLKRYKNLDEGKGSMADFVHMLKSNGYFGADEETYLKAMQGIAGVPNWTDGGEYRATADARQDEQQPDYSAPEMKADEEYKLASEPMDSTKQFLGGEQQTGTAPDINADTPETDALFASFLQNFMETSTDANKMDAASRMLNPKGKFISTQANRDAVRAMFPDELTAYVNTQTPKQVQNTPKTAQSQTAPRTTAPQTTTQSISGANHAVMLDAQRQQQEQQRAQQQSARQQAQDAIQSQRIGEMRGAMAQTAQMPPEAQREQFAMQAVAGNMEDRIRQGRELAAIAKEEGVTFRKGVGKALESGAEKSITAAQEDIKKHRETMQGLRNIIEQAAANNDEVADIVESVGGIDRIMQNPGDAKGIAKIARDMEKARARQPVPKKPEELTPRQRSLRLNQLRKERQQDIDDTVAWMRNTPGGQGVNTALITDADGNTKRVTTSNNPQWYQDAYKKYGRKPKVSEYPDIAVDTLSKMQHFSERDAEIARLEELQRQGKEARAAAKQPQAAKQEQTAPQEAQPQTARTETETDTSRTAPAQEAAQTAEKEARETPAPAKEEQGEAHKSGTSQTKAASKSEPSAPTTKGRETKYKAVTYDVPTETLDAVSKRYNIQGYRENGKNTTVFFDSEKDSKRFFDAYKDDALEEAQAETEQEPEATQNETRTEPEAPIKTETKQEPAPQDVASKATKAEQGERIFGDRDTANREMLEALGLTEEELEDEFLEAPPGIENTAEERERLERELAEELNKLGANPVFNPKIYTLGLKLAMTYVKDGINTVKKLIAKLNSKFGDNITPWAAAIAETVNTWPKGVAFDEKRVMAISKAIGAAYEDGHTSLDDVQGEMQKLLKGKHKQFAPMIEASYNGIKKFFDDKEAAENVDDSTRGLAARAGEWANQDAVGRNDESGGPRRGSEREGVQAADDDAQPQRSVRVRDGSPASRGETGDSGVQAKESEDRTDSAGSVELSGSVVDSLEGSMALDRGGEAEDIGTSQDGRNDATPQKIKKNVPYKAGDLDSVKADLPMLLPAQQEDVVFAEKRLDENGGAGVLFTNGTGTGKTFTGLGIVKRMYEQGKKNILIVSPTNDINNAWIKAAKEHFGLDIKPLADTKDGGKEKTIAITTYANFRQNRGIAKRNWDAVIADESHNLMNNKDGSETAATSMLRALTMNVRGIYRRARELFRTDTIANLEDEIADIEEAMSNLGTGKGAYLDEKKYGDILRKVDGMTLEATKKYLQSCIDDRQNKIDAAYDKMNMREKRERLEKEIAAMPQEEKPKVVFLSATPFSYDKDVDYAEGYLFDYDKKDGIASGRDDFMIKNFGYRMRYNKLTRPDAEVDNRVMEVAFHDKLVNDGVMSGRMLEVDADYDRGFILVDSGIGKTIDEGFQWLRENKKYEDLFEVLNKRFTRRNRRYLLESIKAKEAVPLIREYIKNGKKVVLFHQAMMEKKNFHPFKLTDWRGKDDEHTQRIRELWEDFDAERPDLAKLKLSDIPSPMETIKAAFGTHGLYVDGKTSKKAKAEAINKFNDDNSSSRLIVVQQDAGNAGISLHDVTGKFPRVLINIATPERPSYAMQIEGRIYRVGNKSNATFRYLSTGMDIEKELFANTIGSRAETVENLALGDMARGLTDSFTNLYMETMDGSWERRKPGHPEEGTGGKEMDITKTGMSLFDMAKSFYFAQQKKTSRTKAQEEQDYFATPEPIGMKMVEWLGLEAGDRALEPSAGHGAISRWFSPNTKNTIVEPSRTLSPLAQMVTPDARTVTGRFEDFNIVNKFEGIAMNPPFGHGGKTAVEHLSKAYKHLANGGRMVAIIPEGPAADKQFEKWMDSDDAENASIAATIHLPGVTFGRAGTNVATKIVIIDKNVEDEGTEDIDLRDAKNINELFDRIENLAAPSRPKALPTGKSKAKGKESTEERDSYDAEIDGHKLTVTKDGRISGDTYPVKNTIKKYGARWDRDRKEWVIGNEEDLELFLDDFATDETTVQEERTPYRIAEEAEDLYDKAIETSPDIVEDERVNRLVKEAIQLTLDFGQNEETDIVQPVQLSLFSPLSSNQGIERRADGLEGNLGGVRRTAARQQRIAEKENKRGKIYGLGITRKLVNDGVVSLVGKKARTARDLAEIAQVLRHPGYEKFHTVYTDEQGNVVHHETVTCRLPWISTIADNDKSDDEFALDVLNNIKRYGAKKVYYIHNHPSGDPTPSNEDVEVTKSLATNGFARHIPFAKHIILDHNRYSVIDKNGKVEFKDINKNSAPNYNIPEIDHAALGERVYAGNLDSIINLLADTDVESVVFFMDTKLKIRSVQKLHDNFKNVSKETQLRYLRHCARNSYGAYAIIATADKQLYRQIRDIVQNDEESILDAVYVENNRPVANSYAGRPMNKWFGKSLKNPTSQRVLEENSEYEESFFHKIVDKLGKRMGIKSDKVITEDKGKSPDGISLPQYYLGSPSRIAERVKAFRLFFRMGDNAMNTLTKMRSDFQKKLDRAMRNVGKKEDRDRLYEILWTGDAEGKEFTDAEMREMGAAENVIKAYHGIRQIMRQSYNKLNEARKRPVSHSRRLTNEEINELKKNKFLIGIQSIGDAEDGKRLVTWKEYKHWDKTYDVDAATLEKFKADDAMQVLAEKENEDGSYHVHVREGIGDLANRGGYIPHFFHEYMIRLTDKDGNPIDRIGYGGVIGSGRTEAEAIQKAEAWEKEHRGELKEGEVVRVAPKVFSFGRLGMDDQQYAAIVGDKDYEKMARSIAKSHGMTLKEAREHLKGTARMKNRHRFFGNLLKRQGAKGFEQEMGWVLRHYLNGVSRYYALETEFKPKAISLYERLYGDYAKDAATKEAQYVKDYIHDINGDPTWLEKGLNDLLNRSSIYRNFIAAKFGDRAALRLTSSVSNTVSQLTLGMLNASSALLNLTQVMNSAAYIGDVSALGKCIAKGAQRRYNMRDMRVLAETNVLNDIGLDSGAGYDKARSFGNILNRIGNKGMVLFKATESAIRRGTVLAAYDKAIKDGKTHDEAIAFAKDVNRKSNFDYGVADAPNIFRRGSILSQLALQFKKYSFKELEVMADMLSNKSSRKQKAIFWGTYLLMCGLCGIPALDIWDDWFGGKDTMQKFIMEAAGDTPEGKALGRVAMYGLFAAVPGIDISNRAGMSDVVPTKASDLTGPLVSKTANLVRDFGNGAAMIRDISPGVYNQYAAWIDEREKDKRGRTIVTYDDVYDKMLRAMGFNSTEKRVGMDVQRIIRNERSELTAEKQEAVDEFIRNPTTENAMRLKELGIKPKTVQNERARKKADRMERLASGMNKDERQQYQSLLQFAQ